MGYVREIVTECKKSWSSPVRPCNWPWPAGIAAFVVLISLILSEPALSVAAPSVRPNLLLTQSPQEENVRLENEKLRQEIENLKGGRSIWRVLPQYAAVGTALAALLGFLLTAWTAIRQREAETLRRFEERFDKAVTNLASESRVIQVSAATSLLSFSKPEYRHFHEQVFMVALANLRITHSSEVDRFLVRAFEQSVRQLLSRRRLHWPGHSSTREHTLDLDLARVRLNRVNLSGLDLTGADIYKAEMNDASLRKTILYRARGGEVRLNKARLTDAQLGEARLRRAHAQGAHFHRTKLMHARLEDADLQGAEFQGAELQSAHLNGADLRGANFVGANVNDAYFVHAKLDDEALRTLTKANNLDRAHFDDDAGARIANLGGPVGHSVPGSSEPGDG